MNKLIAVVALSLCMSASSFGTEHLVTHSVKVVGKDTYKATRLSAKAADRAGKDSFKAVKLSAKETGHTGKTFAKLLF
jgi:uncharacterized GH25 family protein